MEDFLSKIWDFFSSDRISLTPKIAIPLLLLLASFLLVDYYGFFYYYANGKKVEYIANLEETKEKCASDTLVVSYLEDMIEEAMNRKNVFQWFTSLFENKDISPSSSDFSKLEKNEAPKGIDRVFPLCERTQFWQTVTSSLFWIIILFFLCLFLFFLPFSSISNKLSSFFGTLFGIGVLVLMIWLTQWIFGLIPVILNRAYINYVIQLSVNLFPILALAVGSIKEAKKKKSL